MKELRRLQELYKYKILDTAPEKELNELAELASVICDTPISLVTLIDDKRQWFKARKGLNLEQTPREDSFCQHALHNPKEVLIVNEPLNDERFKSNFFATGDPPIKFYAGAPLETPNGNVLGTLCILDNKPRNLTESQIKALQLIAKKIMDYLNTRKLLMEQDEIIELSADRLKKLTDEAPGAIYQMEMKPDGKLTLPFVSKGFTNIHPSLNPAALKEDAEIAFSVVHPDDVALVKNSLQESFKNLSRWNVEYRVISEKEKPIWHWANANPERKDDGSVVWFGTFQDITSRKEYINTLEKIVFDISHVMRRPVANMLGLTSLIINYNISEVELKEYSAHLKAVSDEMDQYLRKLNADYSKLTSDFRKKQS